MSLPEDRLNVVLSHTNVGRSLKDEAHQQPFLPTPPGNNSPVPLTIQDMSGSVEVGELVPVIFNKASTAQHHLIRHLIEYENSVVSENLNSLTSPKCTLTHHRAGT